MTPEQLMTMIVSLCWSDNTLVCHGIGDFPVRLMNYTVNIYKFSVGDVSDKYHEVK